MMDSQFIIDHKIAFLSGESKQDLTEEMIEFVEKDKALAKELRFIESFWLNESLSEQEMPSSQLDSRFYKMLNQAKSSDAKIQIKKPKVEEKKVSWFTRIFSPQPAMQFAMMAGCVALGFALNTNNSSQVDGLQREVQSLSSLIATSMLENQSASQRLTGLTYINSTNKADDVVTQSLIKVLEQDNSTAVRLASINSLQGRPIDQATQDKIISLIETQTFPLVQVSLIQLIYYTGSENSKLQLNNLAKSPLLHEDAQAFLIKLQTQHQI